MNKVLIVAHPDDEIIWFNAEDFDRIIIVFRENKAGQGWGRMKALEEHPLKDKIICLDIPESGYHRDSDKQSIYKAQYWKIERKLRPLIEKATEIWTHNAWGESRKHKDHILIHNVVRVLVGQEIPVYCNVVGHSKHAVRFNPETFEVKMNLDFFRKVREIYRKYGVWTWYDTDIPEIMRFYKAN